MRVRTKANVIISDGADNLDCIFGPDDSTAEAQLNGFLESASGRERILNAASFTVPVANVTDARGFYIRSTGAFTLVINNHTGGPFTIQPGVEGPTVSDLATYARCMMEMALTDLVIVASADIDLIWAVWGNPIP
jgi:hypothetical protein